MLTHSFSACCFKGLFRDLAAQLAPSQLRRASGVTEGCLCQDAGRDVRGDPAQPLLPAMLLPYWPVSQGLCPDTRPAISTQSAKPLLILEVSAHETASGKTSCLWADHASLPSCALKAPHFFPSQDPSWLIIPDFSAMSNLMSSFLMTLCGSWERDFEHFQIPSAWPCPCFSDGITNSTIGLPSFSSANEPCELATTCPASPLDI